MPYTGQNPGMQLMGQLGNRFGTTTSPIGLPAAVGGSGYFDLGQVAQGMLGDGSDPAWDEAVRQAYAAINQPRGPARGDGLMAHTFDTRPRGTLRPYRCSAINQKTGHPCRTVLIEAWAPSGALVRRRCKQCGTWATVEVQADCLACDTTPKTDAEKTDIPPPAGPARPSC